LVLLIGIFLAIVAFVLIVITFQGSGRQQGGGATPTPSVVSVVVAAKDLPLGSKITADAVTIRPDFPAPAVPANAFGDTSLVIGQTVRQPVTTGQLITTEILNGTPGQVNTISVPTGKVAVAVQVDQVTGVGTLIKPADHVDMLVAITGDRFPVVSVNPTDQSVTVVSGLNGTSVKLLLQGMQVLATLLPPPPAQTGNNSQASPGTSGQTTNLNGQSQIVILAVDAQQAEVIKYAQVDADISLVLRSADDFVDPTTGLPLDPTLIVPVETKGITLKSLVDDYGVLVPQLVEAILPGSSARP
jgi:Flp pilus assembly protein CpaB